MSVFLHRTGLLAGSGIATPFVPSDVAGLQMWLNPESITGKVQDDSVTSWTDDINSLVAAEATNPPTYDDGSGFAHGRPGVMFDGTSERLVVPTDPAIENGQTTYISIINQIQFPGGNDYVWYWNKQNTSPATVGARIYQLYPSGYTRVPNLHTLGDQSGHPYSTCRLQMHVVRYDGSRQVYQISTDGSIETVESEVDAGAITTSSPGSLYIGKHPTAGNGAVTKRIQHDFLIYDSDIGDTNMQKIADWANARYGLATQWRFSKDGETLSGAMTGGYWRHHITIVGTTAYLFYVNATGYQVGYMTADITTDPHNWTDQGLIFTSPGNEPLGAVQGVYYSGTWYLFYDTRNWGAIRVATGASLAAISDYGGNPLIAAGGGNYYRYPFVMPPGFGHDATNWHMVYDLRTGGSTSGSGNIGHATSSDGLTDWTLDAANNPVLAPTGDNTWESSDVGAPAVHWDSAQSQYRMFYAGYKTNLSSIYPHHMGEAVSSDLTSFTRVSDAPVLPLSQTDSSVDNVAHQSAIPYVPGDGNFWLYLSVSKNVSGTHEEHILKAHEK